MPKCRCTVTTLDLCIPSVRDGNWKLFLPAHTDVFLCVAYFIFVFHLIIIYVLSAGSDIVLTFDHQNITEG